MPRALSGGQRQHVAIGRALVRDVDVFLFDDPLSNLDAKLRSELRVEIKRLHQKLENTMIYVTHDQIEALTLADRIAVIRNGEIQQLDKPREIYNRPVNRFIAGFIGSPTMNFLTGHLSMADSPRFTIEEFEIPLNDYIFENRNLSPKEVILGIRPEYIVVGSIKGEMPFNLEAEVELLEPMGADVLAWAQFGKQQLAFRIDAERELKIGTKVHLCFDPTRASIFDVDSGMRI